MVPSSHTKSQRKRDLAVAAMICDVLGQSDSGRGGKERRIAAREAMAKFSDEETLKKFASVHASIHIYFNHNRRLNRRNIPSRTARRIGPDPMALVDNRLCVRRMVRLRVIDASVLPEVTSTNTNAPTIMIAENGAAMKEDARWRQIAAARSKPGGTLKTKAKEGYGKNAVSH